jgi:hypothetical protein
MVRLRNKEHKDILYNKIVEALGGQIGDRWERKMFKSMVGKTRIRSIDELKGDKGWKVEGQNVHKVVFGPRGERYIGPVDIYVPHETLKKLKGLQSRRQIERESAEKALHTVSHEFAHDYFEAINYEARMTRYLRDHPDLVRGQLARFLKKGGNVGGKDAKRKAGELVSKNPLFWSNYLAHTAHEAGADRMAVETVAMVSRGRHANARDLERLTSMRPFTVREMAKVRTGEKISGKKPKKPPVLTRLAREIEFGSAGIVKSVGGLNRITHPSWEYTPARAAERARSHRRRAA